ncbi:MutS-related protein [Echinicola vietnamensis]|uniref:Mismatch repair ATPase (MutS family) n=1 Tax=Echinicola vietnamensis (strain DSM 17526 / LMG 23754 / KMM 6221) TaxID=926556 RepID=L0FUF8_ECHVK|nr:mismatch repair ATPase [Echinicola vietnamensis]AGA77504.1 mismatch repair ATPase (MutS family) [Echinicola vietnamensis DSM 17526]
MAFAIDSQTAKDLELFSDKPGVQSIFSFFNQTQTFGGKLQLKGLMQSPLDNLEELEARKRIIAFFMENEQPLTINASQMDFIDHYFRLNKTVLKPNAIDGYFQKKFVSQKNKNDQYLIETGIEKLIFLLVALQETLAQTPTVKVPLGLRPYFTLFRNYLENPPIQAMLTSLGPSPRNIKHYRYDHLFREKYRQETQELIHTVYLLDAFKAVAKTANRHQFSLPNYSETTHSSLHVTQLFHPLLEKPIKNSISIEAHQNICFLTGPNMAGKSTFLKSLGLAVYLAHLGFPVPASSMKTPIYKGLTTTINLPDDMGLGHSHFYSEVNRIKDVALKIQQKQQVFVIFDELFRGTNVRDAYEGSLSIVKAFSTISGSTFFISSHILEVAEHLQKSKNIAFRYFEASLKDQQLHYTYRLREGISQERLGMHILKREKVLDILKSLT